MRSLFGIIKQMEESERLDKLESELKSAEFLGKTKCVMCGFCCHRRSCIPTTKELEKIAKFLKMTVKELINKYYVIDHGQFGKIRYVKPLGVNQLDLVGKLISGDRTFNEGKCIFLLKGNKCKIYPVRPKIAKATKCWVKNDDEIDKVEKMIEESWKNSDLIDKLINSDNSKEESKEN